MPEQQQFKRNTAYKYRIGDVLVGKPIFDGERFSFIELGDKRIVRVNIVGNIVDRYDVTGERKYTFLTIDDGSGQIKIKAFGDDAIKLENFNQGLTVVIIGTLRHFNDETYISPEIIKEQDPKYLLVRKLELEKTKSASMPAASSVEKKEIVAVKDKILDKIKNAEDEGGIEVDKIIMNLKESSPDIINQEIKKLLEEGIIFEPRPGKLRWLG
jgi:RPA family protein